MSLIAGVGIALMMLLVLAALTLMAYDLSSWLHYCWRERQAANRPAPHYPVGRHRR